LPTKEDGEVNVEACLKGPGNDCFRKYGIKIKICEGFSAYFLMPIEDCDAAYCFGMFVTNTMINN